MAKVTVPNVSRAKMAAARSGERTLPPIKMIAFGDGGVDENGVVQTPSPTMNFFGSWLRVLKRLASLATSTDIPFQRAAWLGKASARWR